MTDLTGYFLTKNPRPRGPQVRNFILFKSLYPLTPLLPSISRVSVCLMPLADPHPPFFLSL